LPVLRPRGYNLSSSQASVHKTFAVTEQPDPTLVNVEAGVRNNFPKSTNNDSTQKKFAVLDNKLSELVPPSYNDDLESIVNKLTPDITKLLKAATG
jgi:hypothetical protein